jgi:hypothetical protein
MKPGRKQVRRNSMLGTALLALGIIAALVFAVMGSVWPVAAALVVCAAGVVLLYHVGKALS